MKIGLIKKFFKIFQKILKKSLTIPRKRGIILITKGGKANENKRT